MFAKIRQTFSAFLERHPKTKRLVERIGRRRLTVLLIFSLFAHVVGALTSMRAIMEVRTAQGTVAWVAVLNAAPVFAVPAYWVFGRSQFQGYVLTRRHDLEKVNPIAGQYLKDLETRDLLFKGTNGMRTLVEHLAKWRFTVGNDADLLIDGDATFKSIFEGIDKAKDYVLVEYYIFRDDELGIQFKQLLRKKAREGVRVYMLFDEMGSPDFGKSKIEELRVTGIYALRFNTRRGPANSFQVNFRNHRKIVVVDGREAWVGGLNVGDEYVGRDKVLTPWRDTHVKVTGPVVQGVQMAFLEDWHWASQETLKLTWDPKPAASGVSRVAMALPTGPVDAIETGTLLFLNAINLATNRLWIASPYFVPDEQFVSALQLAALRGVDVRILVPGVTDNNLVQMCGWSFLPDLEKVGIKTYRYKKGFMHQKVMLVDDLYSAIGTSNFDNRSFRLNFEITMALVDEEFSGLVRKMLENDFANSEIVHAREYSEAGFWKRFQMRCARLSAPIQ